MRETSFCVLKNMLDDMTALDACDDMLNPDAYTGNYAIDEPVCNTKFFAFRLFARLKNANTLWSVPLKASVLLEFCTWRVVYLFGIRNFFVMRFSVVGLAKILDTLGMFVDEYHVFVGVGFFLPL